jgi:hypothetical protein
MTNELSGGRLHVAEDSKTGWTEYIELVVGVKVARVGGNDDAVRDGERGVFYHHPVFPMKLEDVKYRAECLVKVRDDRWIVEILLVSGVGECPQRREGSRSEVTLRLVSCDVDFTEGERHE